MLPGPEIHVARDELASPARARQRAIQGVIDPVSACMAAERPVGFQRAQFLRIIGDRAVQAGLHID